jgi:hypothetical protein
VWGRRPEAVRGLCAHLDLDARPATVQEAAGVVLRDGVERAGLSIADLTGVGVADAAVASAVFSALNS